MFPQSQAVRTGSGSSRLPEVLDTLKSEFEQLNHEASVYKAQRDENERKRKHPHRTDSPLNFLCAQVGYMFCVLRTISWFEVF